MKHAIFSVFILSALSGFSQSSQRIYVANSGYYFDSVSIEENISSATMASFNKMFNNVENARWHLTDEGSTVKFKQGNVNYHVFYNKRGKWKAIIQYLPPDLLPKWVKGRVRSDFRKFSIFFAQNVKTPAGSTYLIKIEKGNEWKHICISPVATEVLGEYVRN